MKKKDLIAIIIAIILILGLLYFLLLANRIPVTKIYLNKENLNLLVGEKDKLEVTIEPDDASNKSVIWESSNPSIVVVDETGNISAIQEGTVVIEVKTKDGKVTDSCIVNVYKNEIIEATFKEENIEVRVGENKDLEVDINPKELEEFITLTSSDESILKVDDKGKVYGIKNGKAVVSVKMREQVILTTEVRVVIPVDTLSIENESLTMEVNQEEKIKYIITPPEAADQEVIWESSDTEVITVDNGKILAKKVGEATIKVSIDGKETTCRILVIIPVKGVKLNKSKVKIQKGESSTITATVSPTDATNKEVTWTSSNERIAKVDKDGKVTGLEAGEVTITATADGKKALCTVVVTNPSIVSNSKYYSGYNTTATYNSDTLKYRIIHKGKDYYTLIWVENANKQWNSAMPKIGQRFKPTDIISREIKKYGYQNKGLIATNGSAFWDNWGEYPTSPFMINKGTVVRDMVNKDHPWASGVVGITENGVLKLYHGFNSTNPSDNTKKKQTVKDDGVRNNFTIFNELLKSDGTVLKSNIRVKYTALCQINENNYVIYSGESLTFEQTAITFRDTFKCKVAYRFDGGGSRTLYYKTKSMSSANSIYDGRDLPDMMYFVEQ